ncbi:MAG: hypothetical protein KKG92_05545, partial [Gammaproteobacteria bacterium]|nr:hypothetical protein [Gammaproteobacteria bacterium]
PGHGEFVLSDLPSFPRRRESRFVNLIKPLKAGLMNTLDSRLPHAGMTKNQRLTIRTNLP